MAIVNGMGAGANFEPEKHAHLLVSSALLEVLSGKDVDEVAQHYSLPPEHLRAVHRSFAERMDHSLHGALEKMTSEAVHLERHRGVYSGAGILGVLYGAIVLLNLLLPVHSTSSRGSSVGILLLFMYIPGVASFGLNALARAHGWGLKVRRIALFFVLLPAIPLLLVVVAALTNSSYLETQFQQILLGILAGGLVLGLSDYVSS